MSNILFNIFPNENFIDLCMYQFGYEQCDPGHSFGPATRNHYLFHYIISGTGTLMADNAKGETQTYSIKSGQGFIIFPGQINTYIADKQLPWEYMWIEFDGLRIKEALSVTDLCKDAPIYHSHSKELREKLADEMLYIVNHPHESSFHLIGHLYLFMDYLLQSAKSTKLVSSGRMSDCFFYIIITHAPTGDQRCRLCRLQQIIQKQIQMPDQMEGGFLRLVDDIKHFIGKFFP